MAINTPMKTTDDMEWSLICQSEISRLSPHYHHSDLSDAFRKVIDIWRDQPHTVNRRLAGAVAVDSECDRLPVLEALAETFPKELNESLLTSSKCPVSIRRLVSKSALFSSAAFEVSFIEPDDSGDLIGFFYPVCLDDRRNPHVVVPYRLRLTSDEQRPSVFSLDVLQQSSSVASSSSSKAASWLQQKAFPVFLRWLNHMDVQRASVASNRLVNVDRYAATYRRIKDAHGKALAANWPERTNAEKFVYEDCAIAAYLVELWNELYPNVAQTFLDIGCGNGLLVHLLGLEGHRGIGLDLRKRNIWAQFSSSDLREFTVNPSATGLSAIERVDWLIGNHSDELTPWIPVMAARSASNFFLLPCCPFEFFGKFRKNHKAPDGSHYGSYIAFVQAVCERLGFEVHEDRLKIPSTKRTCFIGVVPAGGLPADLDDRIRQLTKSTADSSSSPSIFTARPKVEPVRNCSQLPRDFRQALTRKIFDILLGLKSDEEGLSLSLKSADERPWRMGGRMVLADLALLLSADEKQQLKAQCGGLQTFLRNEHQVFAVADASVGVRDWRTFGPTKKAGKRSICWFFSNHPDGCPLTGDQCSYVHEEKISQ